MKHLKDGLLATVLLLCLSLASQPVRAQFVSDYLFWGASGGYSTLLGKVPEMTVTGFANGGLHIGWEVRRTNFIYRPIFLDLQYFSSKCNTDVSFQDVPIKDTKLGDAILHFKTNSPLTETQRFFIPSIGFMVGYSGNDRKNSRLHGSFYCLGGFKISPIIDIRNNVNLKYSTSATYERYIDDYEDMPNHFYEDKESKYKEKFGPTICGMFTGEIGWELNVNRIDKFKIGAFAEVGFTNILFNVDRASSAPDTQNATNILVRSYYASPEMDGKYVVPIMAGLKITYSFNTNYSRDCLKVNCRMGYRIKNK